MCWSGEWDHWEYLDTQVTIQDFPDCCLPEYCRLILVAMSHSRSIHERKCCYGKHSDLYFCLFVALLACILLIV